MPWNVPLSTGTGAQFIDVQASTRTHVGRPGVATKIYHVVQFVALLNGAPHPFAELGTVWIPQPKPSLSAYQFRMGEPDHSPHEHTEGDEQLARAQRIPSINTTATFSLSLDQAYIAT